MKQLVLSVTRCENCRTKAKYYIRDENVNSCLSDKDIHHIIAKRTPQNYDYCDKCKCTTLQTLVAWEGT